MTEEEVARYRAEHSNETGDNTLGLAAILREEGMEKGIKKGKQEGESALLLRLMTLRFGPLDDALRKKIQAADADTLLQWGERILTAATAEEVVRD